jgi:hypothetical protein
MESNTSKDAFDRCWEWANKPQEGTLTIPAEIHDAVMTLTEEARKDRAIINKAVRTGRSPLRPAGSADRYGVPIAEQ